MSPFLVLKIRVVWLILVRRTITLTRKLFTMLLSVIVYNHKLTPGQWAGTAVVFLGISVEAWAKRSGLSRINRKDFD